MKNFETWKLTFTAELVSTSHINPAMLHELIENALRSEAGAIGYLVGESRMELNGLAESIIKQQQLEIEALKERLANYEGWVDA